MLTNFPDNDAILLLLQITERNRVPYGDSVIEFLYSMMPLNKLF
jgi:hypothetical protein